MQTCLIKKISLNKDLQTEINNFLMLNQEKKITSTQLLFIPPVIFPIPEIHPIKKVKGIETATGVEARACFLFIAYYES